MYRSPAETYVWLIAPVDRGEFERRYYQQRVCVVHRQDPAYYRELLSVAELDHVLATHTARTSEIAITQLDKEIPAAQYASENLVVDPLRAAQLFAGGATLIFNHLHTRVPALARMCTALSQALSSKMQANVYFTPGNAQGFKPHWDTHDVFVLQVSGSKRWTIFDTKIPLPLLGQKFNADVDRPGDPTEEFELRAGDMVYIPRGVMHAARATDDPSLHITTGLMAYTWADFFLQGVAAAGLADPALRENLPLGFSLPAFPAEEKARLKQEKLARLQAYFQSEPPFPYFSSELISHNRPLFVNQLSQVARLRELGPSSTLRPRAGAAWELEETETACRLRCYGNEIELPRFVSPAVRFALSTPSFAVQALPDCLDAEGKLTLARRLVKEGLLECVELAAS